MWTSVKAAIVIGMCAGMCAVGCATAPDTAAQRENLTQRAEATLETMIRQDPGLKQVLDNSAGYVVFPRIAKGGALVGGAYGQGILYENGRPQGFAKVEQASLGAVLGGETFAELLILQDPSVVRDVKTGDYTLGAGASVTVLTAGAARAIRFNEGVAAVIMPIGGLMVDVSIAGQRIQFQPAG